ncbi:acetyl-CoA/propionyl-CoA carboxylase carboxyl transferase subunit [Nonomuraea polychroma]|uniref:Acetyl-CoA/propionyl-CoA carboxylase carboxyl transferase subunit n=1 Tax=Nonomuraea polychroma TaxID=46176 RepID=A0A438LZN6_9ACTN|nr:carboxyl transferase domain-containing protein [Nonomuraea polychroma]RVX38743.1 acetyl-CoA/propionyl-CoA carboxylase carboxyl transferase subunit [Nonomuraea polychroma]
MTVLDTRVSGRAAADPRDPLARVGALLDDGSLHPITPPGDRSGVLASTGRVNGVQVVAFSSDARIQGGAMGREGCGHILRAYDVAMSRRIPIIGIWHSGGARLAEGVSSLHGVGLVFAAMTRASGVVPQLSVVVGPAAGGAAYGPALTDLVILADDGRILVTGPDVIRSVTGEQTDMAALGGPVPHSTQSGVVHVVTASEREALERARELACLLGRQERFPGPVAEADFSGVLPDEPRRAYDVRPLVTRLLDGPGVELHPKWAPNVVTTLGRLGGRTIGVVANNPLRLAGCLNSAAAEKAARFVRMCDAFGVPLAVLVDVPGYLPSVEQEHSGIVRRGAKLLHAFAEASVPRVTLMTRKAYGGAYIAMNSRSLGATRVFAWPSAEVAVMGATHAVRILKRRELAAAPEEERAALEARLADEHAKEAGGLDRAVELGVVDEVIEPRRTRGAIAAAIARAAPARGRHANIPL